MRFGMTAFVRSALAVALLLLAACGGGGGGGGGGTAATAAATITWAPAVYTFTDNAPYAGVISGPPDNTTGGWNLASGTWLALGSTADLEIDNFGKIGAPGLAYSTVGFNTAADSPAGYVTTLPAQVPLPPVSLNVGDVLVVQLRNGMHAKLRIDALTLAAAGVSYSSVSGSYMLEQGTTGITAVPVCTAPPAAPATFTASQSGNNALTLTWTPSAGATSYTLYSQATPGVTKASSASVISGWTVNAQGKAVYTLTNVPNGTYYGAMSATNACGESALSPEGGPISVVVVVPAAPTGLSATAGNAQASFNWTAVTGAASYNLYYSTASGVSAATGTQVANATPGQAITGLTNNTTYYAVATAVNSAGESAASAQVSVTPYDPAVPQNLALTKYAGFVRVCLSDMSGTAGGTYNLYRATAPGVAITAANKLALGTIWAYGLCAGQWSNDDTSVVAGTTYYYRATSVINGIESAGSTEVSIAY